MNNNYGETPNMGLDGVVQQPNSGYGLPNENVVGQSQQNNSFGLNETAVVPTNEELNQYNNQRVMAPDIDGPVQYAHEIETSRMDRANDLLDSLKTGKERQAYEKEQNELDARMAQVQTETILRNETAVQADRERIQMQYAVHPKQQAKIEERQLPPNLIEILKKAGKTAVVAAAVIGVSAGIVAGAHSVLTKPEFVPEQTPQSIELQKNIDNAQNMNDVIDAINEHKENQEGVISNEIIEGLKAKEQQEQQMQELREEGRQRVVKIESGETVNQDQVIDSNSDTVGGRGL